MYQPKEQILLSLLIQVFWISFQERTSGLLFSTLCSFHWVLIQLSVTLITSWNIS